MKAGEIEKAGWTVAALPASAQLDLTNGRDFPQLSKGPGRIR